MKLRIATEASAVHCQHNLSKMSELWLPGNNTETLENDVCLEAHGFLLQLTAVSNS